MKYFITDIYNSFTVGIKFSSTKQEVTLGGNKKFIEQMRIVMKEYFEVNIEQVHYFTTCANKIKFSFCCRVDEFLQFISKAKENNLIIEQTHNLNRIWW